MTRVAIGSRAIELKDPKGGPHGAEPDRSREKRGKAAHSHGRSRRPDRRVDHRRHNRFRGLLVRWERVGAHYLALLQLACGLIAFQQAT